MLQKKEIFYLYLLHLPRNDFSKKLFRLSPYLKSESKLKFISYRTKRPSVLTFRISSTQQNFVIFILGASVAVRISHSNYTPGKIITDIEENSLQPAATIVERTEGITRGANIIMSNHNSRNSTRISPRVKIEKTI